MRIIQNQFGSEFIYQLLNPNSEQENNISMRTADFVF